MVFVAFGKLPLGAYFFARGRRWVKSPMCTLDTGQKFNAYCVFKETKPESTTKIDLFDEAMLVNPDPDGAMARWADII